MSARPQILDHTGKPFQMTAYHGADRAGRELATWHPGQFSADGALLPELETLRDRTEDMIRNHGIASGAVQTHLDNIIGPGLLLDSRPDRRALGLKDGERADEMDEFENMLEAKFENYAEGMDCYIDASRRLRFSDMCAQAYRSYLTSFEILATGEWLRRPGTKYRTAIQMIDPARLSNPRGGFDNDRLRAGVALDAMGAPVGYHIATHLNADRMMSSTLQEWKFVPRETVWGRQMVMHVYDADKPGQSRGKNGIVSVLAKMKMLEKFEQATMQTAVLNAMYAAVIQSSLDWNAVGAAIGTGDSTDPTLSYLKNVSEYHKEGNVRYNGAKVMHLFPGEEFKLLTPEHPGANFSSFEEATLRYIARGFNLTYEQLSGDYSKTNYSSARAAMLEAWRFFNGKQYSIAGRFASMIYQLWFEEAVERGEVVLPSGLPDFYEAKSAWTKCTWIGPGRGHIDPLKEANATKVEMSMGLSNLQIEAGMRGRRWQDLIDQRSQEDRYMRKRGIDPAAMRGDTPVPQTPDVQQFDTDGKPIGDPEGGDGGTLEDQAKNRVARAAGKPAVGNGNLDQVRGVVDAYGIAVRGGAITPQPDDENAIREMIGLPAASTAVNAAWTEDGGVRRPITLKDNPDNEPPPASAPGADPNNPVPPRASKAKQPISIEIPGLGDAMRALAETNERVSQIAERTIELQESMQSDAAERHDEQTRTLQQTIVAELSRPTVLVKDSKGRTIGAKRVDHIQGAN